MTRLDFFLVISCLLYASHFSFTSAAPLVLEPRAFDDWFYGILHPSPGKGSLQDEIKCYALPYGGLGAVSHTLTFYTALVFALKLRPLAPWTALRRHNFDMNMYFVSAVGSVVIAGFTMSSCRNHWQFVLLAFWKPHARRPNQSIWCFRFPWERAQEDQIIQPRAGPRNPRCSALRTFALFHRDSLWSCGLPQSSSANLGQQLQCANYHLGFYWLYCVVLYLLLRIFSELESFPSQGLEKRRYVVCNQLYIPLDPLF